MRFNNRFTSRVRNWYTRLDQAAKKKAAEETPAKKKAANWVIFLLGIPLFFAFLYWSENQGNGTVDTIPVDIAEGLFLIGLFVLFFGGLWSLIRLVKRRRQKKGKKS